MQPDGISLIREYGSFGALVCLAAWFCGWVVPKLLAAFERQAELFRQEQEAHRKAAAADREADRQAAAEQHANCHEANKQVADVLRGLVDEIRHGGVCRATACQFDERAADSGTKLGKAPEPRVKRGGQ